VEGKALFGRSPPAGDLGSGVDLPQRGNVAGRDRPKQNVLASKLGDAPRLRAYPNRPSTSGCGR
jgi:hypothetical protein